MSAVPFALAWEAIRWSCVFWLWVFLPTSLVWLHNLLHEGVHISELWKHVRTNTLLLRFFTSGLSPRWWNAQVPNQMTRFPRSRRAIARFSLRNKKAVSGRLRPDNSRQETTRHITSGWKINKQTDRIEPISDRAIRFCYLWSRIFVVIVKCDTNNLWSVLVSKILHRSMRRWR